MRAAVIRGGGSFELADVEVPEPGPGQVRVRLQGSGVCGSDLPVWQGRPWFEYPLAPGKPGHEGWGVVDAVGPDVSGIEEGARVAGLTYQAYADYDVVDAGAVVPLPPELGDAPFPGEALGCAYNVFRRSAIGSADRVAVVGAGFMGGLVTQLAARAGAEVTAITRRESARAAARAMGATETRALDELHDLGEFDVVVEAAGVQATLDACGPLTRVRGRLVIAGFHQDGPRTVDMQLWNWRGIDVINAHERDPAIYVEGMKLAAAAVASGALDPSPLYTHAFPLERLGEALDAACERPDGFVKALVLA